MTSASTVLGATTCCLAQVRLEAGATSYGKSCGRPASTVHVTGLLAFVEMGALH